MSPSPLSDPRTAKLIVPVAAMGVTAAVRSGMGKAYEKRTGAKPPRGADADVSLGRVLGWAVATAVIIAVVDVLVQRAAARVVRTAE